MKIDLKYFFKLSNRAIVKSRSLCVCCGVKIEKGFHHCDFCYGRYLAYLVTENKDKSSRLDLSLFDPNYKPEIVKMIRKVSKQKKQVMDWF